MEHALLVVWVILLLATLIYLGLLYQNKQYRHRYAFLRLVCLFSLLLLLRPLPAVFLSKPQHLFVMIDTSRSMKTHFPDFSQVSNLQELLPRQVLNTLASRYPNHTKHYYDLYHPKHSRETSENRITLQWPLQSPILKSVLAFIEMVAPPEGSQLLLISDGHDTEFEEIPEALQENLRQTALSLDALVLPFSEPEPDIAIAQVHNPRVVFKKATVSLEVTIRSHSKSAQTAQLVLTDGQAILDKNILELPVGNQTFKTVLNWTPLDLGNLLLFLRLTPLAEEKNLHNNVAYIPITVRSHRHRVLHIAGRPSWDVAHLRTLLKSIPALDLISFYILRDPYRDTQTVSENELALIQFPVKELFQIELFKFDTVIFHNFAIQSYLYNTAFQKSFQKYLKNGKKIIVIGGEQAVGQQKYQQLFLKPGTHVFDFEFYDLSSVSPQESQQLSLPYLRQQPSFASVSNRQASQTDLIQRTHFDLGQVDWIANPFLWKNQHLEQRNLLGQAGDFAAFWQTLLYQAEYETVNVFREFQQRLPYTITQPIGGTLHLPAQSTETLAQLRFQVLDQVLNSVVWDTPLSTEKRTALQLPALSPSLYELRLSCDCQEMSDILQKLTVVDEWLELRTTAPKLRWLKQLVQATGGQVIEL